MADEIIFKLIVDLGDSDKQIDAFQKKLEQLKKEMQSAFQDLNIDLPVFAGFEKKAIALFSGIVSVAVKAFSAIKDAGVSAFKTLYATIEKGVGVYSQFEDDISTARRTMGLTREETEALGEAMDDLSLTIRGATANEMYKIAGIAGNLGLNFKDGKENVERFVAAIQRIGIATDLSVEQAAAQIPSILTQFRVANDQMGIETERFGNVLNELGNKMNVTQSQILKVASSLSGSAVSAGMTKEQMLALSAAVGVIDKKFGTAGGNVSQILVKLITDSQAWAQTLGMNAEELLTTIRENPVKALEMVLGRLDELQKNTAVDEFAAIIQELGLRGYRTGEAMKKLVLAKDELGKALNIVSEQMEKQDSLNKEAEASADRLSKLWATVQNAISLVYKAIGKPFVDVLNNLLSNYVIPLVAEFTKWFRESESVRFAMKAIAENLGAIVSNHLAPLATSMLEWITSSNTIDEILREKIPSAMLTIQKWVGRVIDKVHEWFNYLVENGDSIWEGIKQGLSDAWDSLGKVVDFIKEIPGYIEEISPGVKILVKSFTTLFEKINDIINLFTGKNETLIRFFQGITDRVYGVQEAFDDAKQASDDYTGMTTTGVNEVTSAVDALKTSVDETTGAVNELGIEAVEQSVFPDMKVAIAETAEELMLMGDSLVMIQDGVMLVGQKADQAFQQMALSAEGAAEAVDKLIIAQQETLPIKEMRSATGASAETAARGGYSTGYNDPKAKEWRSVYADLNELMDKQKALYGGTEEQYKVSTQPITKLAEGVYTNAPYLGIEKDIKRGMEEINDLGVKGLQNYSREIEKMGYSVEMGGKSIHDLSDDINQLGNDAVYHSVFPDIQTAVEGVDQSLSHVISTSSRLSTELDVILGRMRDGTREATELDRIMAGMSARPAVTPLSAMSVSPAQQSGERQAGTASLGSVGSIPQQGDRQLGSVIINFQGQNIIDESSKNRFARQISQQIQGITGRNVSVA